MVNGSVQEFLKVWSLQPSQNLLPSLLPWLEERFEAATFLRDSSTEGSILYVNCAVLGVVSAGKTAYMLNLITGFLAARPQNGIAVLIHPNRAAEGRRTLAISLSLCSWPFLFAVSCLLVG